MKITLCFNVKSFIDTGNAILREFTDQEITQTRDMVGDILLTTTIQQSRIKYLQCYVKIINKFLHDKIPAFIIFFEPDEKSTAFEPGKLMSLRTYRESEHTAVA